MIRNHQSWHVELFSGQRRRLSGRLYKSNLPGCNRVAPKEMCNCEMLGIL